MVETLLKNGEYAPVERIALYADYPQSEVEMRLGKLNKLKLVQRWTGAFVGYTLTFAGYDALALNALYNSRFAPETELRDKPAACQKGPSARSKSRVESPSA